MARECVRCGEGIPPTRANQARYCSIRCRKKQDREQRKDKIRAEHRAWRQRNREHVRAKRQEWLARNADQHRLYQRDWARRSRYGEAAEVIFATPENYLMYSRHRFRHAIAQGYRSGLEVAIAKQLDELGIQYQYEVYPIAYTVPSRPTRYTPDFILPNGIIVEAKGRLPTTDRKKHRLIREQYPDLDLRFVFSNPNTRIGKTSKTTYGMWCERLGIPFAHKTIPEEWLKEKLTRQRHAALRKHLNWEKPS